MCARAGRAALSSPLGQLLGILTPSPGARPVLQTDFRAAGLGSGVGALLGLTCLLCGVQVSPVHPVLGVVLGGVQVGVQAPPLLPVQK